MTITEQTPPPLPAEAQPKPSTWTLSIDVPVGDEKVHVVARMEPDTVGEARSREALAGRPLLDILHPEAISDWVAVIVAAMIRDGFDGEVAVASVDAMPVGDLVDAVLKRTP